MKTLSDPGYVGRVRGLRRTTIDVDNQTWPEEAARGVAAVVRVYTPSDHGYATASLSAAGLDALITALIALRIQNGT